MGPAGSEEEKEVAPPLIQSRRNRGPIASEGIKVVEESQSEAPSASLMNSGEGAETQPGSPSVMIPALKIPEPSQTTRPIGGKVSIAEAPLVQVFSSSSEGDDHDIGSEPTPHDVSKFLHVTEDDMQAQR